MLQPDVYSETCQASKIHIPNKYRKCIYNPVKHV